MNLKPPFSLDQLTISLLNPQISTCEKYCLFNLRNSYSHQDQYTYRSRSLSQAAHNVFPDSCHTLFTDKMAESFSSFQKARIDLIQNKQTASESKAMISHPLSLLLVNWNLSLFDGACSPETQGYINDDCMPGWDTWLTLVTLNNEEQNHALLCWIPPELCRDVNDAILVDAASCMTWLYFDSEESRLKIVGWGLSWPG